MNVFIYFRTYLFKNEMKNIKYAKLLYTNVGE